MDVTRIVRGEQRWLPLSITVDGEALDMDLVEDLEVRLGPRLRKKLEDMVTLDGQPAVPLTREETEALPLGRLPIELWVEFQSGEFLRAERDDLVEILPTEQRRV